MNTIDNGIGEILKVERVITETKLYFKVTFIDWYGAIQTKNFMTIDNLENQRWCE